MTTVTSLLMMMAIMDLHPSPLNLTWMKTMVVNLNQLRLDQETTKKTAGGQDHMETTLFTNAPCQAETSLYAFQLKPEEIVGRHVLQKEEADGTRTRAKILELVEEFEGQRNSQPERVKFKARIGDTKFEKLIDYSDMCELIDEQTRDENGDWRFLEIVGHTTPKTSRERPKLLVKWESGERYPWNQPIGSRNIATTSGSSPSMRGIMI